MDTWERGRADVGDIGAGPPIAACDSRRKAALLVRSSSEESKRLAGPFHRIVGSDDAMEWATLGGSHMDRQRASNPPASPEGEHLLRRLGVWEVLEHTGHIDGAVSNGHHL